MRTKSVSQLVMLVLLLTTLMLSPVAYAQDSSATTASGGGGGGTAASLDCRSLFQESSSSFDLCYEDGFATACFNKFTGGFQGCGYADRNDCTVNNVYAANNTLCNVIPLTCESLLEDSSSYFDLCSEEGYASVCFNKFTGVYHGCGKADRDDCTEYNIYAAQNIRCDVVKQETCTDSDGGKMPYVFGYVEGYNKDVGDFYGEDKCKLKNTPDAAHDKFVDSCDGELCAVNERGCYVSAHTGNDVDFVSWDIDCPNGCKDGACIKGTSCSQEGEMCAGIAGIACCEGLTCEMEGNYPDAAGKCVSPCGACPQFSPPYPGWCENGTVVAGSVDKCGCQGPPKCEKEEPKQNSFRNAYWQCFDSTESYEGGLTSCKTRGTWQKYADDFCEGKYNSDGKQGVNALKLWNPCYGATECSRDLGEDGCEAAGGTYDSCPPCKAPAGVACTAVCRPTCICEKEAVYCEDEPYNSDCVCREGERTIVYDEPACEEGEPCPLMHVRIKYECVTKEKAIKARLGEAFDLKPRQAVVIVDYNEMQVKLTAISSGKRLIEPPVAVYDTQSTAVTVTGSVVEATETTEAIPVGLANPASVFCGEQGYTIEMREDSDGGQYGMCITPDGLECDEWQYLCKCKPTECRAGDYGCDIPCTEEGSLVAHLVITMPGSNRLVKAREEVRAAIASITGRVAASNAGSSGGGAGATSAAKVLKLRQGESGDVFGATITLKVLDREHGLFVVSKEEIVPCPTYNKCDDGTIKPCYQQGNVCVCEACEVIDSPLCKPTVCPDGDQVECGWDGENCVCEACGVETGPVCGNGICEDGEDVVCQSAYSDLGTVEEVCYIACPEDCGTIEEPSDCDGCVSGTRCLPYGSRRVVEDTAVFCDFEGAWQGQLAEGVACQNSYECETNSCSSGKCLDLEKQLAETQNLLRKILDWLKRLFGGED